MPRTLVGTPVESKKILSALLLKEWDARYNREPTELTEGTYEIGEVLVNAGAALGDSHVGLAPTFSDALCLENVTVPAGETWEVACLARGPALVNMDEVVKASDSETDAALRTRLADLAAQGVVFVREPALQGETDRDN